MLEGWVEATKEDVKTEPCHGRVEVKHAVHYSGLGGSPTINFLENSHQLIVVSSQRLSILLCGDQSLIQFKYVGFIGAVVEGARDGIPDFLCRGETNKSSHQ